MLQKISALQYADIVNIADAHDCGSVYPLSVAEGIQKGDIFTNKENEYRNILFWTHCGFAYLSTNVDECFLEEIYDILVDKNNTKRFLLMTRDYDVQKYFEAKENVVIEKRYLFAYSGNGEKDDFLLPVGYELKKIDKQLLAEISGRIVPSLFWKDSEDFLSKGEGYCVTYDNDIASWAFSAAVSSREIDIGIETNPKYREKGLGMIVANKMIQATIGLGKKPVWACHYKNAASKKMAEKLGFVQVAECSIIKSN